MSRRKIRNPDRKKKSKGVAMSIRQIMISGLRSKQALRKENEEKTFAAQIDIERRHDRAYVEKLAKELGVTRGKLTSIIDRLVGKKKMAELIQKQRLEKKEKKGKK